MKLWLTVFFYFSAISCITSQVHESVLIQTENGNDLIAGINNSISIVALQQVPITVEQIAAYLITPSRYLEDKEPIELKVEQEYGKFMIRPDSIGVVEFYIEINGTKVRKVLKVKPLEAVCRLSRYKANTEAKIPSAEFKSQIGIIAYVECCGFDAKCKVLNFEIIRIRTKNKVDRAKNKGGRFEEKNLSLIQKAQSGDIFIFRNLYYQCPSSEQQRSDDMIFEIE